MSLDRRSVEAKLDDAVVDGTISPPVAKEMYEAIARSIAVFVKMAKEKPQMKNALKKGIDAFMETLKPDGNSAMLPKVDAHDELILLAGELVWKMGFLQATPREGPCSDISALSDEVLQALVSSAEEKVRESLYAFDLAVRIHKKILALKK